MDTNTFQLMYRWISSVTEPRTGINIITLGRSARLGYHHTPNETTEDAFRRIDANRSLNTTVGRIEASLPALASLAILVTGGPGHWLAHLAANSTEKQTLKKLQ